MFQDHRVHQEAAMPPSRPKPRSRMNCCSSYLTESQIKHYLGIPDDGYDPSMFALATTLPLSGFPTENVYPKTRRGAVESHCHHLGSKSRLGRKSSPPHHAGKLASRALSSEPRPITQGAENWAISGDITLDPYNPSHFQDQGISTVPLQTNFNLSRDLEPGNGHLLWDPPPSTSTASIDRALNSFSNQVAGELRTCGPSNPTPLKNCDDPFGTGGSFLHTVPELDGSANDSSTTSHPDMGHCWDDLACSAFIPAMLAQQLRPVGYEEYSHATSSELLMSCFSQDLLYTPETPNLFSLPAFAPPLPDLHPSQSWLTYAEDQPILHSSLDIDNTVDRVLDEPAETIGWDSIDQTTQDSSLDAMEDAKSGNLSDMDWLAMFDPCTEQHEQQQEQQKLAVVTDPREGWWKQLFSDIDGLEIQPDYTNEQSETLDPLDHKDWYID